MQITLIGWIFIALSVYGFVRNKNLLLYLMIIASVFTAASVINIQSTVTGIQPFYLVGTLWILRTLIEWYKRKISIKEIISKIKADRLLKALVYMMLAIILSEFVLLIFNGKFKYLDTSEMKTVYIRFNKSNITQPIYALFGLIIAFVMRIDLENERKLISNVIKTFIITTFAAVIWGLIQFILFYVGVKYPSWIFNNNISYAQLYDQIVHGIKRINSVALEPSMFALNIMMVFPGLIILFLGRYKLFASKVKSMIFLAVNLAMTFLCAILTTSTTAYVGIVVSILLVSIYVVFISPKGYELEGNKRYIGYIYCVIILIIIVAYLLLIKVFNIDFNTIVNMLKDMTVNKKNLQSGNERTNAVYTAVNILKMNPITGCGYGSYRSLDLVTQLLANTGILGLLAYLNILYVVLRKLVKYIKINEVQAISLLMSIIVASLGLMISIPDMTFGYYWISICIAYIWSVEYKEEQYDNRN